MSEEILGKFAKYWNLAKYNREKATFDRDSDKMKLLTFKIQKIKKLFMGPEDKLPGDDG